jgi:hypothetical protein
MMNDKCRSPMARWHVRETAVEHAGGKGIGVLNTDKCLVDDTEPREDKTAPRRR